MNLKEILCKIGIHHYKRNPCPNQKSAACLNNAPKIRYVCEWCGKVKKVKVW